MASIAASTTHITFWASRVIRAHCLSEFFKLAAMKQDGDRFIKSIGNFELGQLNQGGEL